MRVGFVILAHERLDRAGQLVRHLRGAGAPVVVHLDRRAAGEGDFGDATVVSTHASEWGTMSLVEATLGAVRRLMRDAPDLGHVFLASGSCLPVRPLGTLAEFLAEHPDRDFIESVPLGASEWVQGGLSEERFTLRHPFPWRRRRRLFDASVALQRRLGLRRRLPEGLVPHLGSQWWCLSTRSLRALTDHPRLDDWRRFFQLAWIPDEGFFQSLIRQISDAERLEPSSLTLARFDAEGLPHVFHDDQADWLAGAGPFFARKIDPDAGALYSRFLDPGAEDLGGTWPRALDTAPFDHALTSRRGQIGLQTQGRYPSGSTPSRLGTARPWIMIAARNAARLAQAAAAFRTAHPDVRLHSRLFAPAGADFADGGEWGPGNLSSDPRLRDYRPDQFLARLIFAEAGGPSTAFLYLMGDTASIGRMAMRDANARVALVDADPEGFAEALRKPAPPKRPGRKAAKPYPIYAGIYPVAPHAITPEAFAPMTGDR